MLDISEVVIAIDVDAMNLNLVTWASHIDQVVQEKDFFLAGNTARRHSAWGLLDRKLLIVTVHSLDIVNSVRAVRMAHNALGKRLASLVWVSIVDRALHITALAPEEHLGVLREDLRALSDNAFKFNQGVQMNLAQFSKLVLHRELTDANKDFLMELLSVVGIDLLHNIAGNCVQDR